MQTRYRQIVETYWQAANARRWEDFAELIHPEVCYEVPQTRERIVGRERYTEFNRTYPGDWRIEVERLVADDQQVVSKVSFATGEHSCVGISFFEFRDDKIYRIVDFWPEPYEPPVRLIHGVERY
jgi:predicted ester cyclase